MPALALAVGVKWAGAKIGFLSLCLEVWQGAACTLVALSHDRQAEFEALVQPLVDQLYGAALRMTRRAEAAEDLVQDALLRAWRFYDRYEQGTNFRAWVFRILTNLYINSYRQADTEPPATALETADREYEALACSGLQAGGGTPEEVVLLRLEAATVRQAIDGLPDSYRLPVILCDLEGFSYREISEMLEVPIGTVMSRIYRGRRLLCLALHDFATQAGYTPKEVRS